jgi:hypothetical protein
VPDIKGRHRLGVFEKSGGKARWKRHHHEWENNIIMDLRGIGWGGMD